MAGPIIAKDGRGEAVLLKLPPDGKMELRYEYRFADEANQFFPRLFEAITPIIFIESVGQCLVETKKRTSKQPKEKPSLSNDAPHQTQALEIQPEETNEYVPLEMQMVSDNKPYQE